MHRRRHEAVSRHTHSLLHAWFARRIAAPLMATDMVHCARGAAGHDRRAHTEALGRAAGPGPGSVRIAERSCKTYDSRHSLTHLESREASFRSVTIVSVHSHVVTIVRVPPRCAVVYSVMRCVNVAECSLCRERKKRRGHTELTLLDTRVSTRHSRLRTPVWVSARPRRRAGRRRRRAHTSHV